jgi:HPt (histidine-containing phosphotransfer) domain-containing protein
VETGDADAVKKVAHTLKGGSASLAATAMAGSCKALQELAEAGSLEGAEQLVLRIEHDFEVAREALTAEVGQEVTQ